jgi:putative ABC transport system permease protein
MQIVVSNCRASLDVVVFRGVRATDAERVIGQRVRFLSGSMAEFLARGDAALVGSALADRRRLNIGDRFQSAGVDVIVAGVVEADSLQDRNACYVHLPFLQDAAGGVQGGEVTQFEVEVDDPKQLVQVASSIDELLATDRAPTSTRPEKAFVARAAEDLVAIAAFAGWLGIGALVAVFALVANAIVLSLEARTREIAVLQSLGFTGPLVAWSIVVESLVIALLGSIVGGGAAYAVLAFGHFGLGAEGVVVEFRPSLLVTATAISLASLVGIAAGFVPAISVARRSIVEGLKAA